MSLKYKDLVHFRGVQEDREKKGDPKNEGMSNDVYENKGQKIPLCELEIMLVKTKDL
jgi:hypothetical protein